MTRTAGRLPVRLGRILSLIPYAIQHPGVSLDELAEKFGISPRELRADLDLIFLCGLPGYTPADLIEVDLEGDNVYVRTGDYFEAPLNLTPVEAFTLYAGGAALAALPEMQEADALKRALKKLGRAIGIPEQEGDAGGIRVSIEAGAGEHVAALQEALSEGRGVRIEYLSATRGELTERDLDPWALIAALGRWYVVGFDHSHGEERMFRTDRIKTVTVVDRQVEVPADFDPEAYRGAFTGRGGERRVTFEISPQVARWFEDYYPVEEAADRRGGWRRVTLVAGGDRWAATLLLKLGDQVRAIDPAEVLAEARAVAAQIAQRNTTA